MDVKRAYMSNFRDRLKILTKPLHDEIEKNRFSSLMIPEQANIEDYKLFLRKLLGFIEPIENVVFNNEVWIGSGFDKICAPKAVSITDDLRSLGVFDDNFEKCSSLPKMDTFHNQLGVWYVLEGSMIGASMQFPIFKKNLGIDEDSGLKYMSGYKERTFEVWGRFVGSLNGFADTSEHQKEIILSAMDTFISLSDWLNKD